MRLALDQARGAAEHGDVPIGAVVLDPVRRRGGGGRQPARG